MERNIDIYAGKLADEKIGKDSYIFCDSFSLCAALAQLEIARRCCC